MPIFSNQPDISNYGDLLIGTLSTLLPVFITALYFIIFHASEKGATPEKILTRIKTTRSDGERITFSRSLARYFSSTLLSTSILFLDYIMAALTDRKQALHDMVCDTVVVDRWAYTDESDLQDDEIGMATIIVIAISFL